MQGNGSADYRFSQMTNKSAINGNSCIEDKALLYEQTHMITDLERTVASWKLRYSMLNHQVQATILELVIEDKLPVEACERLQAILDKSIKPT